MNWMVRREFLLGMAGGALTLAWPASLLAAPKVEADPEKTYWISPEAGPWVIVCSGYGGSNPKELARQVSLWLRRRGYAAYIFDRGAQERDQEQREYEELKRQNPNAKIPHVKREEQCAVLIGGFKDQNEASEVLRSRVRNLPPPTDVQVPGLLTVDYQFTPLPDGRIERAALNPFAKAYLTPNPTMQQAKPTAKADPFLVSLNENEPLSLLQNKSRWTLVVREFRGNTSIVPENGRGTSNFLDKLSFMPHRETPQENALELAGKLAWSAANWLRNGGYDAYVLHTPDASLVTVGGFDALDTKDNHPMQDMIDRLLQDTRYKKLDMKLTMMALEIPRP